MAYVNNEDELNQQGKAGGQVLAGSGGAATGATQAVGTGFTNLQKYLDANKGQGTGLANDITSEGQKAVDTARSAADTQASGFVDYATQQANSGADNVVGAIDTSINQVKNNYQDRAGALEAQKLTYGGPADAQAVQGSNDLDKAYQNVRNTGTGYASDRATQQAGLQKKYGYGSGFGALDTFLGRQDGKEQIQSWAQGINPGSAQGAYDKANQAIEGAKGRVTDAQGRLTQALSITAPKVPAGVTVPTLPDQLQPGATGQGTAAAPTGMKGYVDTTPGTAAPQRPTQTSAAGGTTARIAGTGGSGFGDLEDKFLRQKQNGGFA